MILEDKKAQLLSVFFRFLVFIFLFLFEYKKVVLAVVLDFLYKVLWISKFLEYKKVVFRVQKGSAKLYKKVVLTMVLAARYAGFARLQKKYINIFH